MSIDQDNPNEITESLYTSSNERDGLIMENKSSMYDDLWEYKSEADDLSKYDDFHTIDWSRDRTRDRMRFRNVKKLKSEGNTWDKLKVSVYYLVLHNSNNIINNNGNNNNNKNQYCC